MKYNKKSARELYDGVVHRINILKRDMARIDGQLAAWDAIRAELYEQMMAEQQEQEAKDEQPYQPQDPTRNKLFQPKGPEETNGQQTH